jgi:hypothetical protein
MEHDLFGKAVSTFPDHALVRRSEPVNVIRLTGEPVAELTDDRLQLPRKRPHRGISGEQSLRRGHSISP